MAFKGFNAIDWETVFKRFKIELECGIKYPFIKELLKLIRDLFIPNKVYHFFLHKKGLLFFISFAGRKSVSDSFENVRSLYDSDIIEAHNNKGSLFFYEGIKILVNLIPAWLIQSAPLCYSIGQRLFILRQLVEIYRLNEQLKSIDLNNYNLLVTYYDSWEPEAFMVQLFRQKGAKSVSLQHGQFTVKCGDNLIDSGVELRSFSSDYLLCWNKFTYDEAIKCGIPSSKLIIAGIWTFINKKRVKCHMNSNGVFGVVIGHPSFSSENEALINAANILSEKFNFNYYLKLHPNFSENYFDDLVNDHYIGNIKKGISMIEYANQVDFSLIGSTSVFVELVYIGHDIYRYSSCASNDKYQSVSVGKIFNNVNEIEYIFERERHNDYSNQLFDYLCTVDDCTLEYKKFFGQFTA